MVDPASGGSTAASSPGSPRLLGEALLTSSTLTTAPGWRSTCPPGARPRGAAAAREHRGRRRGLEADGVAAVTDLPSHERLLAVSAAAPSRWFLRRRVTRGILGIRAGEWRPVEESYWYARGELGHLVGDPDTRRVPEAHDEPRRTPRRWPAPRCARRPPRAPSATSGRQHVADAEHQRMTRQVEDVVGRRDRFRPVYQPSVDLGTGRVGSGSPGSWSRPRFCGRCTASRCCPVTATSRSTCRPRR